MKDINTHIATKLSNPLLAGACTRVVNTFVLAAQKAAAHIGDPSGFPMPNDSKAIEHVFLRRLQLLPAPRRAQAAERALAAINAPATARQAVYGDLSTVELRSTRGVVAQVRAFGLSQGSCRLNRSISSLPASPC